MGVTHRPMGSAWWLGGVLALDLTASWTVGSAPINPLVAGLGAVIAPVFAAGRLSPDADVTWLKKLGHRQATHRPDTTAMYLTVASMVVFGLVWMAGPPLGVAWLVLAPVTGWWSHCVGDFVFGRIPLGPHAGRALSKVLPRRLISPSNGRQAYWTGLGLDTDGLLERGTIRTKERTASGLHKTVRPWWMLGLRPTTMFLQGSTVVLYVAVVFEFISTLKH